MSCEVKHPVSAHASGHRGSASTPISIALPVVPAGGEPPSHRPRSLMGPKRAMVLGIVQLVMILHLLQWLWTGSTVSPVEPSEAMETVKNGIVNAGAVLFGLALLSTVLLGRFFCGWGCHVVMLQDLCGWMLRKVGVRPKPFRSRLLLFVPLLLAVYMFLWPLVYRLAIAPYVQPELVWPGFRTAFVVTDFWRTFPGILLAIPFFLVCGFLTVYLLGAKGYCTYGCPYGGFFAPLDEFAVGRIRVTDACEHCGHCTGVCTSNVRVHEEVRDFGMVVDPGCMKCMDCVSACPNDALYFGFGRPAVARSSTAKAEPRQRSWDLSWKEEIALAIVAVISFVATRGSLGFSLPLLFASGVTACAVFLVWKAWRTVRDPNVRFHGFQLRLRGRIQAAGVGWLILTALVLAFLLHSATVNAIGFAASWLDDRIRVPPEMVFSGHPVSLDPPVAQQAERALALYGVISAFGEGGVGLVPAGQPAIDLRRAWLLSALGRFGEAETLLRSTIDRHGMSEPLAGGVGRVLRGQRRDDEARRWYQEVSEQHPRYANLQDEFVLWLVAEGRSEDAIAAARLAAERNPATGAHDLMNLRRLSLVLMEEGTRPEVEEGIALTLRTLELAPDNPFAYRALALGYGRVEQLDEAEAAMRRAVELAPTDWRLLQSLGELLMGIDRPEEGAKFLKEAATIRQQSGER